MGLPGGVTIQQENLIGVIQPALTPLMPVFNILDAVIAVFNTVKAIPESLGPPPDPTKLVSAVTEMTKKVSKLLRLVPQLSLPYTILGLIDLVLDTLGRLRDRLVFLAHSAEHLASVTRRAEELNDSGLAAVAACAQANIEQEAANLIRGLGSVEALLGILGTFTSMIGAPAVPDLSSLSGRPLGEAVQPLDDLVKTLQQLRSSVPVP